MGVAYAAIWTVLEPAAAFLHLPLAGPWKYGLLLLASAIVGIVIALPPVERSIRVGATNTTVTVRFGDIFTEDGLRTIPVNEFFDSLIGSHVSASSLHGRLIAGQLGGHADAFDRQVGSALSAVAFEEVVRPSGKTRRYPLGTAAVIDAGQHSYLAVATAHTDIPTLKAHATVGELWGALGGLWMAARVHTNGRPLVLPLVGGGLSNVGLPAQHLLAVTLISAIDATKAGRICEHIKLILPATLLPDVDLSILDRLAN